MSALARAKRKRQIRSARAPRLKCHVKRGDFVRVTSGSHAGAEGKILSITQRKEKLWAIVEGAHMIKKHVRPTQDRPEGGIIEREGPIHVSNLKLIEVA